MPPSLPAPSTASLLSKDFDDMVKGYHMRLACGSRNVQVEGSRCLKPQLHPAIRRAAERGKAEHFRVVFVRQIVDSPKDREVRRNVILRSDVYERIVLDIEIRCAKVQFLSRIHELCFDYRAQLFEPKIC